MDSRTSGEGGGPHTYVIYSIQFRRELTAGQYVRSFDTAGEIRSKDYITTVHSFQRPALHYCS
jgi:hypothetical protein